MKGIAIVWIASKNFVVNLRSSVQLARVMKKDCCSEVWGVTLCDHARDQDIILSIGTIAQQQLLTFTPKTY
jgi:hypothetical protein